MFCPTHLTRFRTFDAQIITPIFRILSLACLFLARSGLGTASGVSYYYCSTTEVVSISLRGLNVMRQRTLTGTGTSASDSE